MLNQLLEQASVGQPLWLPDLRHTFAQMPDGASLIARLKSFDGKVRDFAHTLPRWSNEAERALVRDYLCATVYNTLSVCGGSEMSFFVDPTESELLALLRELPELFQLKASPRGGLGKAVSIANRMGRAFGEKEFCFTINDIAVYQETDVLPERAKPLDGALRALCQAAEDVNCVGVDVGGTDIKLAASLNGRLIAVKEYDWNPAVYQTAEEIIAPILLLTRLMRACIAAGGAAGELKRALEKDAGDAEIAAAVAAAESRADVNVLDAVGVSFPDIVLYDRIAGGETPKTSGMRRNAAVDYEAEFAKLGTLQEQLRGLCRGEGRCHIVNDGNMAAFTAAMELACGETPERIGQGVVAHSLGTDLGTGWLDAGGKIPQLPLEFYDVWLDLGSAPSAKLPPEDLRATRNENSGLPGLRRYLGQSAAYRLAWELDPHLLDGFAEERDGVLRIASTPEDLRKPCLEHLMQESGEGNGAAEEVFRRIGRNFGVMSRELDYLLRPGTERRFLFGRFVKSERCFALLREGCAEAAPELCLENGGEDLANTPLMAQLARREDATVAQFAQAVGSIYYALT